MFIQQLSVALGIISLIGFIASSGKQKKISAFLLGLSILAGIITFSALDHHSLSPPKQSVGKEQSVGQEQQPVQEMAPIVIDHDGEYDLPDHPLKVCFTMTGDPAKGFYVDQQLIIENTWQVTRRQTGCEDLPASISGRKVEVSLGIPGKQYTPEIKGKWSFGPDINNDYDYYRKIGVSQHPVIQAR